MSLVSRTTRLGGLERHTSRSHANCLGQARTSREHHQHGAPANTALHAMRACNLHLQIMHKTCSCSCKPCTRAVHACRARLARSGTSATHQRTTQGSAAATQKNVQDRQLSNRPLPFNHLVPPAASQLTPGEQNRTHQPIRYSRTTPWNYYWQLKSATFKTLIQPLVDNKPTTKTTTNRKKPSMPTTPAQNPNFRPLNPTSRHQQRPSTPQPILHPNILPIQLYTQQLNASSANDVSTVSRVCLHSKSKHPAKQLAPARATAGCP